MKITRYVVQYKSVYQPKGWLDSRNAHRTLRPARAEGCTLAVVNPNVRIVKCTIVEEEV